MGFTGFHRAGCCCGQAAPCECPEGIEDLLYKIVGYGVNYFDASGCQCQASASPEWDGVMDGTILGGCVFTVETPYAINGKEGTDSIDATTGVRLVDPGGDDPCYWLLSAWCYDSESEVHEIWSGRKYTGDTPVGRYTRTGGCDETRETADLEEYSP